MSDETRRKVRWLRHVLWIAGVCLVLALAGVVMFFGSGAGNPLLRRLLVGRIEAATGTRVELGSLSVEWSTLHLTLHDLVIHGREPAGTEPLFAAEKLRAGLRIDSFWGKKISLDELEIARPQLHLRIEKNGTSNLPVTQEQARGRPLRETLFDLRARRVRLTDGWVLYNDVKTPVALEGSELQFGVDASGPLERPQYVGSLNWQEIRFTHKRFLPVTAGVDARFTLSRDGFRIDQAVVQAGRSKLDFEAEMTGFSDPQWTFKYRGWADLGDFRETYRAPLTPDGNADVRGQGTYTGGQMRVAGDFAGQNLVFSYPIFHAGGITGRGSYTLDNRGLTVPDLKAQAFGGTVTGRVTMRLDGLKFRADTRVENVRLAPLLPAVEHLNFPVDELHWDAVISAETTETWNGAFEDFQISGVSTWSEPADPAPLHIPLAAGWKFRYRHEPQLLTIEHGELTTANTRATLSGALGESDSALEVHFETGNLESYNDFVAAIAGPSHSTELARRLSGSGRWDGTIYGAAGHPTFGGHLRAERIGYGAFGFDSLEADVVYSPTELTVSRGRAERGATQAELDGSLALTDWNFLPDNSWTADISFDKTPVESLQAIAGTGYPVAGMLSGQFHGRGTRREPAFSGLFDLESGTVYGVAFNRLRGQLVVTADEARISNAELRVFPAGKERAGGAGVVTGSLGYRFADKNLSAELVGAGLPLENFPAFPSKNLPLGGLATFRLKVTGTLDRPVGEGNIRVVDLRLGPEVIGSFDGKLTSDGREARLELGSAMSTGEITGGYTLGLAAPYPIAGKVTIKGIDLTPFLLAATHARDFSGHGSADGDIELSGSLGDPNTIVADAKLSRLALDYANVQLENQGAIHFRWSRQGFQIDPAKLRGKDTNLEIAGNVQTSGRRTVDMKLNGALELRLLAGFLPGMDVRGPAQVNATFGGTLDRPRIIGRVHIENASARAADFPTGLTAIKGDLVFDATQLFFSELTAEAGGGTLALTGSVNYSDRPLRYEISARTDRVRIRYPEGMSWLAAGSLRLSGTTDAGTLSGRVTIERVTLSQGIETAGVLISAKEGISGPTTQSSFLRNLQFEVEALSTPDARMEWPGAELEAEANLRVRGTWEHPILLGHIHILSGDLYFHGNRYRVSRGDLNFANPFRLDPVLNVEATTTVQQYEITLNFNGPASKLSLAYRSDPPLPANDVITLLALGQTSSEAGLRGGGSQGASSGASALLSEAISSQVGGRLERLFGITRLRVDPGLTGVGSTGSEQNAAARVTVEQQIARNLTITYVSNVSSTQQQVIQVEYNVNRNVSIVALRDQNGTFGIDIKIKKRFP